MSLDLVVVNYHTPQDLDAFLESLARHPPTTETTLWLVDVETKPGDSELLWRGDLPGTRIAIEDNIGYGRACNLAAARGAADVIALCNADVEVTENALDLCHDALLANDRWGVLGPRQADRAGRLRHAGILGTMAAPRHRGWNEPDVGQYSDVVPAVTVAGSAYFIKRSVWDQLTTCKTYRDIAPDAQGAFLPTRHYYEETWCSVHAQAHGHLVVYFGLVTMVHQWHRASPVGGWADRQMAESRDYFRAACDHHGLQHD